RSTNRKTLTRRTEAQSCCAAAAAAWIWAVCWRILVGVVDEPPAGCLGQCGKRSSSPGGTGMGPDAIEMRAAGVGCCGGAPADTRHLCQFICGRKLWRQLWGLPASSVLFYVCCVLQFPCPCSNCDLFLSDGWMDGSATKYEVHQLQQQDELNW
uniref:Uncharacterized protein n=2 Tax=Aegilops tauschii subsp. strangulata TaxID=200361 RepID=A0A453MMF8_AEGTS